VISRLRRALATAVDNGVAAIPEIAYPLLLLAAALVLALAFGKISPLSAGNGNYQGEGTVAWYDDGRGFGVLISDEGAEEIFIHDGSIGRGEAVASGRRAEFISAEIRGRRVALKVWPAT
jgi:cold shock CspA family protein